MRNTVLTSWGSWPGARLRPAVKASGCTRRLPGRAASARAPALCLSKRQAWLEAHQVGAHVLQMGLAPLHLLRQGLHVAQAPLEGAAGKNRRGASDLPNRIGYLVCLVDGEGG